MKIIFSHFGFIFVFFSCCLGQNAPYLGFCPKIIPHLSSKYPKGHWNLEHKKSFLFRASVEMGKNGHKKPSFIFLKNRDIPVRHSYSRQKVHLFVRSGQRLNKALSFSSRAFLEQMMSRLSIAEILPFGNSTPISVEDRVSFFKTAVETVKAPETRSSMLNSTIIQHDTDRLSNIVSYNMNAHLRPYCAINQRSTLVLLGLSIAL